MSRVQILAVAAKNAQGYEWTWASGDGRARAASRFELYYDCVQDAQSHGHDIEPPVRDRNVGAIGSHTRRSARPPAR